MGVEQSNRRRRLKLVQKKIGDMSLRQIKSVRNKLPHCFCKGVRRKDTLPLHRRYMTSNFDSKATW